MKLNDIAANLKNGNIIIHMDNSDIRLLTSIIYETGIPYNSISANTVFCWVDDGHLFFCGSGSPKPERSIIKLSEIDEVVSRSMYNLRDKPVLIAHVSKRFKDKKISDGVFKSTLAGFDRQRLVDKIKKTYNLELTHDEADDFPYFTDGGFKYRGETKDCLFEIVCYPYDLV